MGVSLLSCSNLSSSPTLFKPNLSASCLSMPRTAVISRSVRMSICKIRWVSLICTTAEPHLPHNYDTRQKDGFDGNDRVQDGEGKWIEVGHTLNNVKNNPCPNPAEMRYREPEAPDESAQSIA